MFLCQLAEIKIIKYILFQLTFLLFQVTQMFFTNSLVRDDLFFENESDTDTFFFGTRQY